MNRTWTSGEEMRRGITLMLQGNPYFAWQIKDGDYRPCRDLSQLARFADDIFAGQKTAGFYAIRPDNKTRWGAIDYDAHGTVGSRHWRDTARRAFDALAPKAAEVWLVESSPGGFHVIVFLVELVSARDMRATLRDYAPESVEIFPKQDALKDDPKAKGSLLRFPGKHQLKGTWARFIARSGRVSEPDRVAPAPKSAKWQEPSAEGRLRSLYARTAGRLPITGPGQRYHAMQRLAGMLKGRADENEALWVYVAWHRHYESLIRTPLDEGRKAFLACFRAYAPCNVQLPDYPLTIEEQTVIEALPKVRNVPAKHLREVVRLFFCAKRHADAQGLDPFFLSQPTIAKRLGVSPASANNYVSACRELGIVCLVERGHTGTASTYRLGDLEPFCRSRLVTGSVQAEREGVIRMVSTTSREGNAT